MPAARAWSAVRGDVESQQAWNNPGGWLSAGFLCLAFAVAVAGFSTTVRVLFPAGSVLLALWFLAKGRRDSYVVLCLWLFLLTPGLRRVVDWKAGWLQVSFLMLAPYAATMLCAVPVLLNLNKPGFRFGGLFAALFSCIAYGLLLAFLDARIFAAGYDFLRWSAPICIGLLVALDAEHHADYQAALARTLPMAVVLTCLYGLFQYVRVPPWDVYWMQHVKSVLTTIGKPEPFMVHVFSTMNSPGSFAIFLTAALLFVLPTRSLLRWPALILGCTTLLLTFNRTSWIALLCGIAYLFVTRSSRRARSSIVGVMAAIPLVLLIIQQMPQADVIIGRRIDTLTRLDSDTSYIERNAMYRRFFLVQFSNNLAGQGIGATGQYQSYMDKRGVQYADGEVVEVGGALGLVGVVYMLVIFVIVWIVGWAGLTEANGFVASCGAVAFAYTFALAGGTVTIGENGLMFWIAVGFCLGWMPAARLDGGLLTRPR
jgi:hypothetical protein